MKGYVLGYAVRRRAPDRDRGTRHARARGRRRRPRDRAAARLERLGRHLAPAAGELGRARPARDRGRPARASARRPGCSDGAVLPAAGRVRARARRELGGQGAGGRRGHEPRRLRRAAAGRASRRTCGSPASSRSRPTGSSCRRGSTRSRRTRSSGGCCRSRSRCRASSCAARGRAPTGSFSYQHPSDTQRAVVDAFSRDGETRADLAALLELRPRARARALDTRRSTWSASAAPCCSCGARTTGCCRTPTPGSRSTRCPTTQVELIEGCRPPPAARGHRPTARTAPPVRDLARKTVAAPAAWLRSCAMRRTHSRVTRALLRPRPRRGRRGAAHRRRRHRRRAPTSPA